MIVGCCLPSQAAARLCQMFGAAGVCCVMVSGGSAQFSGQVQQAAVDPAASVSASAKGHPGPLPKCHPRGWRPAAMRWQCAVPGGWPCATAPWPSLFFSPAWQKLWGNAVLPWPKCKEVRRGPAGSIRSPLCLLPPPLEGRVATSSWEGGCRGVSPFPPILPGSGTACDVPFQGSHSRSPWFMVTGTARGCKTRAGDLGVCGQVPAAPPAIPHSLGGTPGPGPAAGEDAKTLCRKCYVKLS